MILDTTKKLILLFPPKTGSQTLRSLFMSAYNCVPNYFHKHVRYNHITKLLPNINLDEYTIYAFYREPISRFMSIFKYLQVDLQVEIKNSMESIPKGVSDTNLKFVYKSLYNEDTILDPLDITIDDIINAIEINSLKGFPLDFFLPQTLFLTDKVTLLDFKDFENNTKMLLNLFGLNNNIIIPKLNVTNSSDHLTDLTEAQVAKIKELYAGDYAFFKSRNITFNN
jgi:hypothetical protein